MKKRSKKLLSPPARVRPNARAQEQKFFGPFFQKRTAVFCACLILLATALHGGYRLLQANRQNALIDALASGRDVTIAPDAPAPLLAARARWMMGHGRLDDAQASVEQMRTAAPALRAPLLYALGNAHFRHALDIFLDAPFRKTAPILNLAKAEYRQSLLIDPDNWDARYNFSLAAALLRDTETQQHTLGDAMSHERAAWPDIPGAPTGMP